MIAPGLPLTARDFIMAPYIACPQCGKHEYGVLSIGPDTFTHRCRECGFRQKATLPPVRKAVIYLDQFAISSLAHIHSKSDTTLLPFWSTLYHKLAILSRLQAIVCPYSQGHQLETLVAIGYQELREGFRMFAHGLQFRNFEDIRQLQILDCLEQWLTGANSYKCGVTRSHVMSGTPDVWIQSYQITTDPPPLPPSYIEALEANLNEVSTLIADVFQHWKLHSDKTWEHWRNVEAKDFGKQLYRAYLAELRKSDDFRTGRSGPQGPYDALLQPIVKLFLRVFRQLKHSGVAENQILDKAVDFMQSLALQQIPAVSISSSIYACLAKKAPTQKKPPTRSFSNDLDVMSCLLPYCDAMFLDRECANYWREIQGTPSRRFPYATLVFSMADKDTFLGYLDELEERVPAEQREFAEHLYPATSPLG